MKTICFDRRGHMKANIHTATRASVSEAVRLLAQGEVIVSYADSIYILCASIHSESAIKRIFGLKGRDYHQPLQIIAHPSDVGHYASLTKWQQEVLQQLMPGPISFIVPKRDIPSYINGGLDTIAIAWQDDWVMKQLYEESGGAYAVTSANLHGQPFPTTVEEAAAYFGEQIPLYIDKGPSRYGRPNTIIDLTQTPITIVREGPCSFMEVKALIAERVRGEERFRGGKDV